MLGVQLDVQLNCVATQQICTQQIIDLYTSGSGCSITRLLPRFVVTPSQCQSTVAHCILYKWFTTSNRSWNTCHDAGTRMQNHSTSTTVPLHENGTRHNQHVHLITAPFGYRLVSLSFTGCSTGQQEDAHKITLQLHGRFLHPPSGRHQAH